MKDSRSVVQMMGITGSLSRREKELSQYDIQNLFSKRKDFFDHCSSENIFPDGMNVEDLKRMRTINASPDDLGYDCLFEKFLKNIVSRKTFDYFKNE